jgi:hypothetical protein
VWCRGHRRAHPPTMYGQPMWHTCFPCAAAPKPQYELMAFLPACSPKRRPPESA